jgi:hypothetical protein
MSAEITKTISEVLDDWAKDRIYNAKELLSNQGVPDTSPLNQSIMTTELKVEGLNVGIGFEANNYYIYLDEGVKGLANKAKTSGLFSFKTPFVGRKMVDSIALYLPRYPAKPRKEGLPKLNKNNINSAAWAVAKSVKQSGINQKPFWKPTFNEAAFNDLASRLEDALGGDINLTLTIE